MNYFEKNLKVIFMGVLVLLILWNLYKGMTVQEIGIPGYTIKFGKMETQSSISAINGLATGGDVVDSKIEIKALTGRQLQSSSNKNKAKNINSDVNTDGGVAVGGNIKRSQIKIGVKPGK